MMTEICEKGSITQHKRRQNFSAIFADKIKAKYHQDLKPPGIWDLVHTLVGHYFHLQLFVNVG
jgi:hypothetical protein